MMFGVCQSWHTPSRLLFNKTEVMKKIKLRRIAELMNAKCGTQVDFTEWPEELSLTGDEYGRIIVE